MCCSLVVLVVPRENNTIKSIQSKVGHSMKDVGVLQKQINKKNVTYLRNFK